MQQRKLGHTEPALCCRWHLIRWGESCLRSDLQLLSVCPSWLCVMPLLHHDFSHDFSCIQQYYCSSSASQVNSLQSVFQSSTSTCVIGCVRCVLEDTRTVHETRDFCAFTAFSPALQLVPPGMVVQSLVTSAERPQEDQLRTSGLLRHNNTNKYVH
jgi:hypothetical protein